MKHCGVSEQKDSQPTVLPLHTSAHLFSLWDLCVCKCLDSENLFRSVLSSQQKLNIATQSFYFLFLNLFKKSHLCFRLHQTTFSKHARDNGARTDTSHPLVFGIFMSFRCLVQFLRESLVKWCSPQRLLFSKISISLSFSHRQSELCWLPGNPLVCMCGVIVHCVHESPVSQWLITN